ncbi:MAG TPA: transposase [Gaiellaceae bacterium]|nr:transposase [Gaiellaceae bacterium]
MPRSPRTQLAGAVYHVGNRGVRRSTIYPDDPHYEMFERILGRVVDRFRWRCHTYCLMPNHYHLVIETPEPNLSRGMQRLNSLFAQWFNAEHRLTGHVFERRFFSRVLDSTYDVLDLTRYVVLNPVRGGLCQAPMDWPWSSYRTLVAPTRPASFLTTDWLLSQFAPEPKRAREVFSRFVDEAPARARSA